MSQARQSRKQHFEFNTLKQGTHGVIKRGEWGDDVRAVQALLTEAGYLRRDRIPGCLCDWTSAALHRFQRAYGLPDTGEADAETLGLMQRPRCGVPDIDPQRPNFEAEGTGLAPFVLGRCRYNRPELTYAFFNRSLDFTNGEDHEIVRQAFAAWQAVTPLQFTEVNPQDSPTFSIAWVQGSHGDGAPFDNSGSIQGNVLAHAFFPPPCGGVQSGALHFDEFEQWTDAAVPRAIRLLNVAIHEIGHLLGLNHSNNRDAIMFAFYDDNVDRLRQDDINGIQALYGAPPIA